MQADIRQWIEQRLKKLDPQKLKTNHLHKRLRSKKNAPLAIDFFSVPLASGLGVAQLSTPTSHELANKVLVLLFHGLGNDRNYPLVHLIRVLNANGFSVLSVDWDGHGLGSATTLDFQDATRSIPLILQRLYGDEEQSGLGQRRVGPACFLMGHSMGGAMTLIAATREDIARMVQGVIVLSPAVSIAPTRRFMSDVGNYLSLKSWSYDLANKISYYGLYGLLFALGSAKRRKFPLRMKLSINYIEQARHFVYEIFEKRRLLRQVKTPVLWFHGMQDGVVPFESASSLMMEIRSAFFSYHDVERGHLRLSFSDQIPKYSAWFINRYLLLSQKKEGSYEET